MGKRKNKGNHKSENYDIIIHVGLHKTGTTFLQKEIFSRMKNINYIYKGERETF